MIYKYYYVLTPQSEIVVAMPNNLNSHRWWVRWLTPHGTYPSNRKYVLDLVHRYYGSPKLWWEALTSPKDHEVIPITKTKFKFFMRYG